MAMGQVEGLEARSEGAIVALTGNRCRASLLAGGGAPRARARCESPRPDGRHEEAKPQSQARKSQGSETGRKCPSWTGGSIEPTSNAGAARGYKRRCGCCGAVDGAGRCGTGKGLGRGGSRGEMGGMDERVGGPSRAKQRACRRPTHCRAGMCNPHAQSSSPSTCGVLCAHSAAPA